MGVDQLSASDTVNPEVVGELPLNNATLEISDGTDNFTDGDVVVVGNWDGTSIAMVIGNANDGSNVVSVDTNVDGTLGGLLG